jgi:spermidine synthase
LAEYFTPSDRLMHRIERVLAVKKTEFQEMQVVVSDTFGRALVLDGTWQSCEADEFIYHESLVHPAMLACRRPPRRVLILGGGEGATAREVLRWRSVERCVMVDIDGEVVQTCREHLPTMHAGAFDDARLELVIADARGWVVDTTERFDVVISDLSDPIEDGPSFQFFTREYFAEVGQILADGGVFSLQAGPASAIDHSMFARLSATVRAELPHVASLRAWVPSFGAPWGMLLGARHALTAVTDPAACDARLRELVAGRLRYLDGATLAAASVLPPYLRDAITAETRTYTLASPPHFSHVTGIAD